jgi:hypothetical protein
MAKVTDPGTFTMAAIAYLERNDFKTIKWIGPWVIVAKDGTRNVLIWLDKTSLSMTCTPEIVVPNRLVELALADDCRLDVIRAKAGVLKNSFVLNHRMNVIEDVE